MKALVFQINIAFYQRKANNTQRTRHSIFNKPIVIEIDFKQKIVIPKSPRQVNAEFYKLEQSNKY